MFPFPPIPPIPGWIKDKLGGLGEFVNPFDWFARALGGVYSLISWYVEQIITHPPRFESTDLTDYLYGNAVGLAGALVVIVTAVLICLTVFKVQRSLSVLEAIIIGVVVTAGAPVWFMIADLAIHLGDAGSQAAMFYDQGREDGGLLSLALGTVDNPLLLISALGPTSLLGGSVVGIVFIYELLNVVIKVVALPALALRPLGPRTRAFSDWTFSAYIVSATVGRPVMVFCIELGQMAGDTLLGGSVAASVFFLCAGLVLAIYMQKKLFEQAQRVVANVSGNTVSKVFGKVETTQKNPVRVDASKARTQHASTFGAQPIQTHAKSPKTKRAATTHYVKQETTRVVAKTISTKAKQAALTASSGGTAAALAVTSTAAKSVATRAQARRDRPS